MLPHLMSRREMLARCGVGMGLLGLMYRCAGDLLRFLNLPGDFGDRGDDLFRRRGGGLHVFG